MIAVDTNVLIYAHDPRDGRKQSVALSILNSLTDDALLWQVACEFVASSRKLEPFGLTQTQARQEIRMLQRAWTCPLPSWDLAGAVKTVNQPVQPFVLGFDDHCRLSGSSNRAALLGRL